MRKAPNVVYPAARRDPASQKEQTSPTAPRRLAGWRPRRESRLRRAWVVRHPATQAPVEGEPGLGLGGGAGHGGPPLVRAPAALTHLLQSSCDVRDRIVGAVRKRGQLSAPLCAERAGCARLCLPRTPPTSSTQLRPCPHAWTQGGRPQGAGVEGAPHRGGRTFSEEPGAGPRLGHLGGRRPRCAHAAPGSPTRHLPRL